MAKHDDNCLNGTPFITAVIASDTSHLLISVSSKILVIASYNFINGSIMEYLTCHDVQKTKGLSPSPL
jgi:hypothetical protein